MATDHAVETEGETIDEAIADGLAALGIGRERAQVEILQNARRGVLGFGGQKARVRVSDREALAVTVGQPVATDVEGSVEPAAVLLRLLALMDIPADVVASPGEEGQTWLRISSEAGGLLIGRHGQTLEALEYLVNRIVGSRDDAAGRLLVDAEGYRERRTAELRDTAARLAARARETGRAQTMNPLGARERRIVHLALAGDETVSTRSVGEGPLRRVTIVPGSSRRQ
jgi:spoIIIJ-associated protein